MGFGIRIAPGVRVRVSSRGVRASVGPRIARVHVGAGRTGFSTGVGPISYYTSIPGSGRSSSSGSYRASYGTSGRTYSEKAEAAQQIQETLKLWTKAHERDFPAATKPVAPLESTKSQSSIFREQKKIHLAGISFWNFSERKRAKELANAEAGKIKALLDKSAKERQLAQQKEYDQAWESLLACDPSEVYTQITDAFGDNESKAAVIDVADSTVSILLLVPDIDVIPERDWSYTAQGNLSVKKMSAGSRNAYYMDLVQSQSLATAKEAFAVCPGLTVVQLLVIRARAGSASKNIECISYGSIERGPLSSALKQHQHASTIIHTASNNWRDNLTGTLQFKPLDLAYEPEIRSILSSIATGDTDYGEAAVSHVGVKVQAPEITSQSAGRTTRTESRRREIERPRLADAEKVADEEIAIKVLKYCSTRETVNPTEVASLTGLNSSEVGQLLLFLEHVGVVHKPNVAGTRLVVCSPSDVENLSRDIRDSISFRRM